METFTRLFGSLLVFVYHCFDRIVIRGYLSGLSRPDQEGRVVVGKNTYFLRVQPSAQNHNLEDYRYVLDEIGLLEGETKPKYCGVRSIYKAFTYFCENIPKDVPGLTKLAGKINQLNFVQITVGSQSDAFALFESLNNRGIPLSAMDIIKNKLLAEMERQHKVDIAESYDRWQGIIRALADVPEQERFLRHFYNAFKHRDLIRVEKVTRATKSQIIRIYETLIKRNALTAFNELTSSAAVYGTLLRPPEHFAAPLAGDLVELQRIGAASAYQILLYLFSLPKEQLQPGDFLSGAVNLLCRYHARRNITDTPATRDLDPAAIELIEACADKIATEGNLKLETFTSLLLGGKGRPAPLWQLRSALEGPIYADNSGMARYLLIQLDLLHHTREYRPDLWARDDREHFVWTIEHVLPQKEKLPPHWVQMIAAGDPAKAASVQDAQVNRLGNLTLSGYNSDLATSSLDKKQQLARDRTFLGHKINIGYRNGLALNNLPFEVSGNTYTLATAPTWSAEMIEARTKAMADLLIVANKLPGEIENPVPVPLLVPEEAIKAGVVKLDYDIDGTGAVFPKTLDEYEFSGKPRHALILKQDAKKMTVEVVWEDSFTDKREIDLALGHDITIQAVIASVSVSEHSRQTLLEWKKGGKAESK